MDDLFYFRRCLGKSGREFNICKIRTMSIDADKQLEKIVLEECDSFEKIKNDLRITSNGKFLRKYWIDELPQLYNLVKGDIKLVGIRPMNKETWEKYPSEIMEKALKQKPGFMGIDYAFAHSNNFGDRLEHMVEYLNKYELNSFRTDKEYFFKIVKNIVFNGVRSS